MQKRLKFNKAALEVADKATGLVDEILVGIAQKSGKDIVSIDLRQVDDAVADFFIICHVATGVQIKSIFENIRVQVQEKLGERPWKHEGLEHLEWVILDYVTVVVHLFLKNKRSFYQLEELWSDGVVVHYAE